MLTDTELLKLYVDLNIPLAGRKVVDTIRASDPMRRVGGGAHNVTARFASRKMGCVIQAESHKGELPLIYQWERDPDIYEFYDQPSNVKLSYKGSKGKQTTHLSTPDFLILGKDGISWVEYKPQAELARLSAKGGERFVQDGKDGWRCPAGEAFAAEYGLGFRVYTEANFNWILVRNLEFLGDYLDVACPDPTPPEQEAIAAAFARDRWMLLQSLLATEGVSADSIYSSIARGHLFVDLDTELLSEPAYTFVCKDELSARIHRENKRGTTGNQVVPLHTVLLSAGTPISWDGNAWRILNVGLSDVVVEDETRAISSMSLEAFRGLVSTGAIVGLTRNDERHSLADNIMKCATPADLEAAVGRNKELEAAEQGSSLVSPRTLRYWRKGARDGEVTLGNRFAGLVPRTSARGNRCRKIEAKVIAIMDEVIKSEVLTPKATGKSVCYGMVRTRCKEEGVVPPSEKTFRAEIKKLRECEVVAAREGEKAAYSITDFCWVIDQSTPRHGERPFEIGHIDHTELDVQLSASRNGANLGKPWLTVLLDAFTRLILAFFITFDPPSYRSCMALIRECVRRHGRIPKTIVVDQGPEFKGLYLETQLARLVTHKKSRPASKARFGSVIERYFGVTNQAFIHNLAGNNKALQRPRSMSSTHDPRDLAVWTLPALAGAFEEFTDQIYANRNHPALAMSPREAMARGLAVAGERSHMLIPYTDDFIRLSMPTTPAGRAVVRPGRGIKIRGAYYWCAAFRDAKVERTKVSIVYDPFDFSRAYALVGKQWELCRSEYASVFERRSEREIMFISQEVRKILALAESNRSVNAEMIAGYILRTRSEEASLEHQRLEAQQGVPVPVAPGSSAPTAVPPTPSVWIGDVAAETFEELK